MDSSETREGESTSVPQGVQRRDSGLDEQHPQVGVPSQKDLRQELVASPDLIPWLERTDDEVAKNPCTRRRRPATAFRDLLVQGIAHSARRRARTARPE